MTVPAPASLAIGGRCAIVSTDVLIGRWASYAGVSTQSRSRARHFASIREICIWETPIRSPIWRWVSSSMNLSRSSSRSSGSSCRKPIARSLLELGELVIGVLVAEQFRVGALFVTRLAPAGGVEGDRHQCALGLDRIEHLLLAQLHELREVANRRRTPVFVHEDPLRLAELERALLRRAGNVCGPRRGAEVAAQLSEDRGNRIGRERDPPFRVVAVDRFDEAELCDLVEVFEGLGGVAIPSREAPRERRKACHELFLRRGVAVATPAHEQLPFPVRRGPSRCCWSGNRRPILDRRGRHRDLLKRSPPPSEGHGSSPQRTFPDRGATNRIREPEVQNQHRRGPRSKRLAAL